MTETVVALMGVMFLVLVFTEPCTAVALLFGAVIVNRVMKK